MLLWNSVRLAAACTVICALLGIGGAWLIERSDVPLRRLWAVLLVLPLGIPDFVVGFGWISIDPALHGYLAAVMIMSLSLYPLVYLPVAGAMANLDGGLIDASRSLGLSPWQSFLRVTMRQIWPAVLGGCLLVTLGAAGRVRSLRNRPVPDLHGRRSSPSTSWPSTRRRPARCRWCWCSSASPCWAGSSR